MNLLQWIKDRVNWNDFCYSLHFFVSLILVILAVGWLKLAPIHAVGVAMALGLLKEMVDIFVLNKTGDILDVIYNMAGCAVGWLLVQ